MVSVEAGAVAANQSAGNKNVRILGNFPSVPLKVSLGHGFSETLVYQSILIMLDYVLSNNRESALSSKARPFSQMVPYRKTNER